MLNRLLTNREMLLLLGLGVAILLGSGVLLWRGSEHAPPPPDTFAVRDATPAASQPPTPAKPAQSAPETPAIASTVSATVPTAAPAPPARIGVGILGAVENEGLYYFDEGARVRDLLQAAGGTPEDADLSDINRTALLIDQTTLLIPRRLQQGNQYYSDPPVTYNPRPYTRSAWYQFNKQEPESAGATAPEATSASNATPAASGGKININTATQAELETLPGIGPATAQKIIAYRQGTPFNTIDDLDNVSGIGPAKMGSLRGLITVK